MERKKEIGARELIAFSTMNAALGELGANYRNLYATLCCDKIEEDCPQTLNGMLEALGAEVSPSLPVLGLTEIEEMLGFVARCQSLGFRYEATVSELIRMSRPDLPYEVACHECRLISQAMEFMSGWALGCAIAGKDDRIASNITLGDYVLPLPEVERKRAPLSLHSIIPAT